MFALYQIIAQFLASRFIQLGESRARYEVMIEPLFMGCMKDFFVYLQTIFIPLFGFLSAFYQPLLRQKPFEIDLPVIDIVEATHITDPHYDIIYYSPKCGHCQTIMPLITRYLVYHQVPIYFVDVSGHNLHEKTPSLKRFVCGQIIVEVSGVNAVLTYLHLNLDIA